MLDREQYVSITKTSPSIVHTVQNVCNDRQHKVHCTGHWTAYRTNRSKEGEDRNGLSQLRALYCVCPERIGWQHVLAQRDHLQVMNVSKLLRRISGLWLVCIYEVCSNSIRIGIVVVVHWWDVFATSLDMFVHVLATHDTSCKWLRLLSWLQ